MNFGDFNLESGNLSATITLKDDRGRRILFGWIAEGRKYGMQSEAGWAGIASIPRILSLDNENNLCIEPVPELEELRREHRSYTKLQVSSNTSAMIDGIKGDCLEIEAEFEPSDAIEFGIKVRCSPDENEFTRIAYNQGQDCLELDPEWSSLSKDVGNLSIQRGPFKLRAGERLKLHIYCDRSVIEVFANNRQCLTKRIYPVRADSLALSLYSKCGDTKVRSLDIWKMAAIWPTVNT
jgi:beta-fructofuranosidase